MGGVRCPRGNRGGDKTMTQEESVPIGELQALVESWKGTDTDPTLYRDSLTRGINELQAVIEAYE